MSLVHVSTFSGVGGIDLAMERAGIPTVAACEIDDAARGVIADRYPDTHLFTDVKKVTADALHGLGVDPARTVLSGGFPCQDLSVAGRRRGMGEGTRSGLFWELDRIMAEFRPAWVVFENVPGLLSATCACPGDATCVDRGIVRSCDPDGHAHSVPGGICWGQCIARHGGVMGAVLGSLAQRGYGYAYRVLDAQHFGVPQRRRRVIIVGRLGDRGRAPVEVLLEPESVPGNPDPSIPARPVTASRTRGRAHEGGAIGTLTAHHGRLDDQQTRQLVVGVQGIVSHTLTAEGSDASEDGTGRGTPIITHNPTTPTYVPALAATLTAGTAASGGVNPAGRRREDEVNVVAFHHQQDPVSGDMSPAIGARSQGMGVSYVAETASTLQAAGNRRGHRLDAESAAGGQLVAYAAEIVGTIDTRQGGTDVKEAQDGRLVATYQKVVRSGARDADGELPPEVWAEREVAATLSPFDLGSDTRAVEVVLAPTLTASLGEGGWAGHNRKDEMVERTFAAGTTVRRLTPIECERLQGFPDEHTVTSNGKKQKDAPRYKQMGNAVAVPVFEWVAHRLVAVDRLTAETVGAA